MIARITNHNNFVVNNDNKKSFKKLTERISKFCLRTSYLFYVALFSQTRNIRGTREIVVNYVHTDSSVSAYCMRTFSSYAFICK